MSAAEVPLVDLDGDTGPLATLRAVSVRRPDQHRRTRPGSDAVGQQRPVGDQLVTAGRHGQVDREVGYLPESVSGRLPATVSRRIHR
jgi:hypothetical protein